MNELIEASRYPFIYILLGGMLIQFLYLSDYKFSRKYSVILFRIGVLLSILGLVIVFLYKYILGLYLLTPLYSYYITNYLENMFYKKYDMYPKDISFWYLKGEKKDSKNINHHNIRGFFLLLIPIVFYFTLLILSLKN